MASRVRRSTWSPRRPASRRAPCTRTSAARRRSSWRCSTSASRTGSPRSTARSHGGGTIEEQARRAGGDFISAIAAAPEWERLFFEFAVYAARNESFRTELVERYRGLRERIAALLEERARELGIEPAIPPRQVALMTFAMANGVALERLLEPEAVDDDLFPTMLATFFAGLAPRES